MLGKATSPLGVRGAAEQGTERVFKFSFYL